MIKPDIYVPWRKMLAGEEVPIHEDAPLPGRWKLKRNGSYLPVAIGPDVNGDLVALVDGKRTDALSVWVSCAKRPITQDAYKFRMASGHWEDEPKPSDRSNRPTDPLECLLADVADKIAQAEEILNGPAIETEVQASLASNLKDQIVALKKQGDAMHEIEKEPFIEGGRRVDTKFRFRETLTNLAANLKLKFEAFMIREDARRRAAHAAEQARLAAERARKMADDPIAAHTEAEIFAPPLEKVQVGGGYGRKAGLRTVWTATLVDPDAAWAQLKDNAKLLEVMQKIVDQAVKAGAREFPGFEIKEGRKAA